MGDITKHERGKSIQMDWINGLVWNSQKDIDHDRNLMVLPTLASRVTFSMLTGRQYSCHSDITKYLR